MGYNTCCPGGFFIFSTLITKKIVLHYSHKVHFCVLRGSENKQRLFLCSVNWLVFITETGSVYCTVRIEISNMTANFRPQSHTMAQTVSRLHLTSDVWVRSQGTVSGFLRVFRFSRVRVPYPFLFTGCYFYTDKWVNFEIIQTEKALSEFLKNWKEISCKFLSPKGLTHISYLTYVGNNNCASGNS